MNAFYIVITVVAALFFVGSGVLLPLFELAEQLPGRRKVRGPTAQSPLTTPTTPDTSDEDGARDGDGTRDGDGERIAA